MLYHTVYSQDLKVGAKEVEVGAGVLNAIRKSFSDKSDTIVPLTKKFIAAFTQRIATYKHQIEQSKESNQSIQTPIASSHQTITMAPPIDNEGEIIITQVNNLTDFSPPDRSVNPIRESFSNLGPSTRENLVGALEEYICGDAIQNLNEEVMSGVNYGANYINEQLFKKVNEEHQQFLNALEARGVNRYIDLKKDKQQETIEQEALIENNQQDKPLKENSPTEQPIGQTKSKKQVILDPDTQKAIGELQEGDALTRAHIRMVAHLLPSPIRFFDESGQPLGEDIGGYKSGKPIFLGLVRGTNGGKDHIKPLNLTPAQRAQYESLDQATNNCTLNALFVHLPKERQQQIKSPEGLRQAAVDYMQEHPTLCRDLFKAQEKLSQLAPTEVPRMGLLPVVPLVQAGLAAWTAWQVYRTGKNIVNDTKVQKSWEERNYIDIFKYAVPYLPVFGDAMRGGCALALGDSKEAWLYPANALFTIYGGKVIGKGSALLFKKIAPEINKLRCGKWITKQGGGTKNTQILKGHPSTITDFTSRVTRIQSKIVKNSITLPGETPNIRYRYDLRGAPHKGVPTPHVQREIRNVAPDGTVYWNKDRKWVEYITSKDLDRIERHLNAIKHDS